MFKVRIVTVDHYMSAPISELDVTFSDFRKSTIKHVPIIRIFGTTPTGAKTCVHVHGVFPYICIPYDGSEPHLKLSHQLSASLDKAINIASGYSTSNTQHVYKVVLVSGIPFYGYHHNKHQFLKIFFYKPSVIKQAVTLLQNGAILNKIFEPHEAHIPFILQFFIDFNLYGMSFIEFQHVKFRKTDHPDFYTVSPELILPDSVPSVSLSQFEVDISACDILNRPSSQGNGQISNPGITAIWEDENRRRAGVPLEAPQLHSQRPPQKQTSSEAFFYRKLYELLENPNESADDSSLSGEAARLSNKSYAIEEPPNSSAIDASFVSMHLSEPSADVQMPDESADFEETIVDEDLALMNLSVSQRLSQTLDKTVTLDYEDLELLDALETLADTRSVTVDDNSVLGSQSARGNSVQCSVIGDEQNSEGEDENWHDKTLAAEDDALKLFDLTMPDIDESAIMNDNIQNKHMSAPTIESVDDNKIPQVDGACNEIVASNGSRRKLAQPQADQPVPSIRKRRKFIIPQVDGANDLPTNTSRKRNSLGMRGGRNTRFPRGQHDKRYSATTGDLIFKNSTANSSSRTGSTLLQNPLFEDDFLQFDSSNSQTSTSIIAPNKFKSPSNVKCGGSGVVQQAIGDECKNSGLTTPSGSETSVQLPISSLARIQNPIVDSAPALHLPSTLTPQVEQCLAPDPQSIEDEMILQHYPYETQIQDDEMAGNLQPSVACCSSTAGCSNEGLENYDCGHDCAYAYIDSLVKKHDECLLRGDPSLYPESPPGREESITDLITVAVDEESSGVQNSDHKLNSGPVRRSSRLASHETHQTSIKMPKNVPNELLKPQEDVNELADPAANSSPSSCNDMEISGCLPGLTTTMFQELQENMEWGTNTDASCSDSEMCRLSGALESGRMEEILQTGSDTSDFITSTTRQVELMNFLESQKLNPDPQDYTPPKDPVTDELLFRGHKPKAGCPPSLGKNMELLKLYCSTPLLNNKTSNMESTSNGRSLRKQARQQRKMKLSISEQRRKGVCNALSDNSFRLQRTSRSYDLPPCSVKLIKITKANIYQICHKFHIKLRDKTALGVRSYRRAEQKSSARNMKTGSTSLITKSSIVHGGRSSRCDVSNDFQYPDIPLFDSDMSLPERLKLLKNSLPHSVKKEDDNSSTDKYVPIVSMTGAESEKSSTMFPSAQEPPSGSTIEENVSHHLIDSTEDKTNFDKKDGAEEQSEVPIQGVSILALQDKAPSGAVQTPSQEACYDFPKPREPVLNEETVVNSTKALNITKLESSCKPDEHYLKSSQLPTGSLNDDALKECESLKVVSEISHPPTSPNTKQKLSKKFLSNPCSVPTCIKLVSDEACKTKIENHTTASEVPARSNQVEHSSQESSKPSELKHAEKHSKNGKTSSRHSKTSAKSGKTSTKSDKKPNPSDLKKTKENSVHHHSKEKSNVKKLTEKEISRSSKHNAAKKSMKSMEPNNRSTCNDSGALEVSNKLHKISASTVLNNDTVPSDSRKEKTSKQLENKGKKMTDCIEKEKKSKKELCSSSRLTNRKTKEQSPRNSVATKVVSTRRASTLSTTEANHCPTVGVSNTKKKGVVLTDLFPNALKDFKIPKKSQSGKISSKQNMSKTSQSIAQSSSRGVNDSSLLTRDGEPICTEPYTEGTAEASYSENSLYVSLNTSDIQLHLSSDNSSVAGKTKDLFFEEFSSSDHMTMWKPGNLGRVQGTILCVDGTSNDSSSGSSSGSQTHSKQDLSMYLKRKQEESDKECSSSTRQERLSLLNTDGTVFDTSQIEIPKSVASWFAKPYSPWSLWSPNSSPNTHHHAHLFSPPQALSPESCNELSRGDVAAVGHGCMKEEEEGIATDAKYNLTGSLCQNVTIYPQQYLLSSKMTDEARNNSEISTEAEPSLDIHEDSSGRTSHSILDMFSEKSFCLDQESSSDDGNEFSGKLSSIILNTSPSSNIDTKGTDTEYESKMAGQDEQQQGSCPMPSDMDKTFKMAEADYDIKIHSPYLSPMFRTETTSQESKSSRESSKLPCGQGTSKQSLEGIALRFSPHSTDFKPANKPPSRNDVLVSLTSLNIPEVINQEPYFSCHLDTKKKIEVGGNVLDLISNKSIHLEEFASSIQDIRGLRIQQRDLFESYWGLSQVRGDLNQLMSCHVNNRNTVIAPIKRPPSVKDVVLWLKARKVKAKEVLPSDGEKRNCKDNEKQSLVAQEEMCEIVQDLDSDTGLHSPLSLSAKSVKSLPQKLSSVEVIQASTPDGNTKPEKSNFTSPLLTPILQTKSPGLLKLHLSKPKRSKKKLIPYQTVLPSVSEQDDGDMGVEKLEEEVQSTSALSGSAHDDSSLKRVLLDSQFCGEAASPLFRHVSDASACEIKGINVSRGFKMNLENLQTAKTVKEYQHITVLAIEIHVCTCGTLMPDPERDPIRAIFYYVCNDVPEDFRIPPTHDGIIAVNCSGSGTPLLNRCGISGKVEYTSDEKTLLQSLIFLVRLWDPDILAGFETEMLSWGYLLQRASVLGINLIQELSRIPNQKERNQLDDLEDNNGLSGLKVTGRIVLDVWRLFRSEVALQSYTFESLMYHILHQRVSHHTFENLSRWWEHPSHLYRWITVQYYKLRVSGVIKLLDQLDIIGRTSELARLFGIQFFEVLSRGSQFRVESMMLRLAKPMNFIPVSPSVQQRAHMRAPECLPLIMEPESRFYSDPVIVLDFQSLYPSMIIAYNYCFSTCLGRVEHLGKSAHFEFGCSELRISKTRLKQLKNHITISPNGIAFVKKDVRQGILPRMLEEILEARLAVKQSMKYHKDDHTLQRVLHARQLGLKLIANVTYGYTSANFSGRMPCIEVGDSVVSKGRETLERSISLVHSNKEWKARVVYGDTDSLFVLVPGRNRQEAFRIGAEIASAVTQDNPSPVKLKLEKVYQPCILQTKKRYVGYMYESADQKQPVYEAKGIETVRRDGCPAVAKMLEKSLRILFETCDVSSVKKYVCRQFSKLLSGQANIQDLIYAREYRGKENYRPGACVPALELTKRLLRHDRRAEPRIGERVPYVIVNGAPGSALIHLVRHPNEYLSDPSLRYNSVYYITRAIIPPLARCFSLLGADVSLWYADLPRKGQVLLPNKLQAGFKKTISQYFVTMECVCCGILTHSGVCVTCRSNPQNLTASLMNKLHSWESVHSSITKICQSCLGRSYPLDCCSLDCPITFRRHQSYQKYSQSEFITKILNDCGISPDAL